MTFNQNEVPVAYSMVRLARQATHFPIDNQLFQGFTCYWTAFNNIYTTIAHYSGKSPSLSIAKDGSVLVRNNGCVQIPKVDPALKEYQEIDLAWQKFDEPLKRQLICHPSTQFFVERIPIWHGQEVEFDSKGQKLNGVINIKYTINTQYPVWSPIDHCAYERFTKKTATQDDVDLLSKQIVSLIYTVRNNTLHGGKRSDDANDIKVLQNALPLLMMIVESFLRPAP